MGFWFKRNAYFPNKGKIDWPETTFYWFIYACLLAIIGTMGSCIYYCGYKNQCQSKPDPFYQRCAEFEGTVTCGPIDETDLDGCKFRSILVGKVVQKQCCKCIKDE